MTSRLAAVAAIAAALLSGCDAAGPAPSPSPTATATAGSGAPPAPTAASTSASTPAAATLASCPTSPAAASTLPVLRRGGSPDDLAVAPDGALWISDAATSVVRLAGGAVTRTISGLAEPEGMIPLPSGDLVVAEQGRQRVVDVHPDGSRTVLLTLPPAPSGVLGVDGIALDAQGAAVLVPDSPHGVLYRVPLASPGSASTLATGLPRVVGVEAAPDGAGLWLAAEAESPDGLLLLTGGAARPVGHLVQLDDAALDGGLLYVTDLRNGSVHAVDPATGADRTVARGFGQPQGLAVLPGGGIAVADSKRGVVQRVTPCGG